MLEQERVDAIPFLIKVAQQLSIDKVINRNINQHGNMKGLSYGDLTVVWLSFILSYAIHCKSHVEDWSQYFQKSLGCVLGKPIRKNDFSDNRLSQLLCHLSDDKVWHSIENDLWNAKIEVYELPCNSVRLDSTTSCGHHEIKDDGIMQLGWSKDHRPDLPQLKLMAAAEGDTGEMIALDVHPGNRNDDPLYTPLIDRIYSILCKHGLLFCGDSKMPSLETRAHIAKNCDYYITPLQMNTDDLREKFKNWVNEAIDGEQQLTLVFRKNKLLAAGYEFEREQTAKDKIFGWEERVLVVKSINWSKIQIKGLQTRIKNAIIKIQQLSIGNKKKQYITKNALKKVVETILKQYEVFGFLQVTYKKIEKKKELKRSEKRKGKTRNGSYTITKVHYIASSVEEITSAIEDAKRRTGWRLYVTNSPVSQLSFEGAILCYRDEWKLEQQFHFLKDLPIGIRPLFVRTEEQLIGLPRFLSIVLRTWTYMRMRITDVLRKENEVLQGVYKGQPKKKTDSPSGKIILEAFTNISVIWHPQYGAEVSTLSKNAILFLRYLGLPTNLYDEIFQKKHSIIT